MINITVGHKIIGYQKIAAFTANSFSSFPSNWWNPNPSVNRRISQGKIEFGDSHFGMEECGGAVGLGMNDGISSRINNSLNMEPSTSSSIPINSSNIGFQVYLLGLFIFFNQLYFEYFSVEFSPNWRLVTVDFCLFWNWNISNLFVLGFFF